jgi:outer membrane protein, heavy metal efflux system
MIARAVSVELFVLLLLVPPCSLGMTPQVDTLRISLSEAEQRFLDSNLQLLAGRFAIDAARAAVIQAQLWSNPTIAVEQNIYNNQTKRYFDVTSTGNTEVALQQLFLLAGKRDKQVQLATMNGHLSEQTYADLLRALKFELRSDFIDLHFLQQALRFYEETLPSLRNTVSAAERMAEKRSLLLGELLRLKSLLFSLEGERLDVVHRIIETQSSFRILLGDTSATSAYLVPMLNDRALDSVRVEGVPLERAIAAATECRADLRAADANVRYEEANLSLQQALAVPDVTVGGRWSRAGSYIPDYFGLTFSIDLPFFNRNQGNIQVSEKTLEQKRALLAQVRQRIEEEARTAYRKAEETDHLYAGFDRKFSGEYRTLVNGMIASYEKRNITIIEFTDFYESYRNSLLQTNRLLNERFKALEALNYAAGAPLWSLPGSERP